MILLPPHKLEILPLAKIGGGAASMGSPRAPTDTGDEGAPVCRIQPREKPAQRRAESWHEHPKVIQDLFVGMAHTHGDRHVKATTLATAASPGQGMNRRATSNATERIDIIGLCANHVWHTTH